MVEQTWLQCTVSKAEWDKINERRLKLGLKWNELLLPATLAYLTQLEANPPAQQTEQPAPPQPGTETGKTKKGTTKK